VIDEAQELAPIELGVLGQALQRQGAVTVCGDDAQHVDDASAFSGWAGALVALGARGAHEVQLKTGYRCPNPVALFAHQVLGPLAPAEMPAPVRDGPPVIRSSFPSEPHAVYAMVEALTELTDREPETAIAIITSNAAAAKRLHPILGRSLPVRLVLRGEFTFTPGIDLTPVDQIKGLEFDVVVIPDVTSSSYPDLPSSRRRLHVACTRAIQQLWVISAGRPSPILPLGERT
jgi:DNA helicase IV